MKNWFVSDHHYFHKNVISYCHRPFKDLSHMHETLINNHNNRVSKDDIVYINGDFGFFNNRDEFNSIVDRMNGRLVWVKGNHDRLSNKIKPKLIRGVLQTKDLFINMVHDPIWANPEYPINIVGHVHLAYKQKSFSDYYNDLKTAITKIEDQKFQNKAKRFLDKWKGFNKKKSLLINVGVDQWNFSPVSLEEILVVYNKWKKHGTTS